MIILYDTGQTKQLFEIIMISLNKSPRTHSVGRTVPGKILKEPTVNLLLQIWVHHSDSTSEIYNIMDDNRMSSVAGYSGAANYEVNKIIESLVKTGIERGLSITQIQAELRRSFTTQKKGLINGI